MALAGCLAELSLAEIFRLLEQGRHSGLLTLRTIPKFAAGKGKFHYIWLYQGRIVAASTRRDNLGLLSLVTSRGWIGEQVAAKLAQLRPINTPMGDYLRTQGVLEPLQLQQLLQEQVKQPVCALFQLTDAQFKFEPKAALPLSQMTGLSLSLAEVTLQGLRSLAEWDRLKHKLPNPTSALLTMRKRRLDLQLDALEWRVWEFANGTVSMLAIARQTRLPLQKVQQIAFRLMVVGLAKEVSQNTSDLIAVLG